MQRRLRTVRAAVASGRRTLHEAHRELHTLITSVADARRRGEINRLLWQVQRLAGLRPRYFSQAGQDAWLEEHVFRGRRDGVFVEIGGYDGLTGSNCLFFELLRGWSGLLIEPSPFFHRQAASFRRAECLQLAVAGEEGEGEFLEVRRGFSQMSGLTASYDPRLRRTVEADPRHRGETIRVRTRPLADVLDEHGLTEIDYVSLDVEGAELSVLSGFPFERFRVTAWTIENQERDRRIPALMAAAGYRRCEALGPDDVYVLPSALPG